LYIEKLRLSNFRNYRDIELGFSRNFNILYGDNAQGKTNILEAVFLCAAGRSHRTAKDSEMVLEGEESFYVKLDFVKDGRECSTEIGFMDNRRKRIKIDGIKAGKMGDMIGHFNAVMFSPEDISVIKEGPSERRRFLDITISQLKPSYFYDLQQYAKIIDQRNSLLKELNENRSMSANSLEVWNESAAKTGARIICARNSFIGRISCASCEKHRALTNGSEDLELRYVPSVKAEDLDDRVLVEEEFLKLLQKYSPREIEAGMTLHGPHRDDYEIYLNEQNIRVFGSQGQQRTAVLSVKLAEIGIIRETTGETPVLLLDDVMSELDTKRQDFLYRSLEDIQTFITCTDPSFFRQRGAREGEKYMKVVAAQVAQEATELATEDKT